MQGRIYVGSTNTNIMMYDESNNIGFEDGRVIDVAARFPTYHSYFLFFFNKRYFVWGTRKGFQTHFNN